MLADRLKMLLAQGASFGAVRAYCKSLRSFEVLDEKEQQQAAELEAGLEGMYLMAAADGEVATEELVQLSASLHAMLEPFEEHGGAELALPLLRLNQVLEQFAERLADQGMERRLLDVASRLHTPESRRLAFCLAAAVAFIDDFVAEGEVQAIDRFATLLGFSKEDSQFLLREVHQRMD